jgi:hypothetical protein
VLSDFALFCLAIISRDGSGDRARAIVSDGEMITEKNDRENS